MRDRRLSLALRDVGATSAGVISAIFRPPNTA